MKELEWIWTDELVMEYASILKDKEKEGKVLWASEILQDFKASHTPDVKMDWKILEGKSIGGTKHDWISKTTGQTCEQVGCAIFSVRRLSDNSVWEIGQETNYGIIEKFFIGWAGMEVHFTNGNGATLASISKIQERTKLFTVELTKSQIDKLFNILDRE